MASSIKTYTRWYPSDEPPEVKAYKPKPPKLPEVIPTLYCDFGGQRHVCQLPITLLCCNHDICKGHLDGRVSLTCPSCRRTQDINGIVYKLKYLQTPNVNGEAATSDIATDEENPSSMKEFEVEIKNFFETLYPRRYIVLSFEQLVEDPESVTPGYVQVLRDFLTRDDQRNGFLGHQPLSKRAANILIRNSMTCAHWPEAFRTKALRKKYARIFEKLVYFSKLITFYLHKIIMKSML